MILVPLDATRFKRENLDNWVKNTDAWLECSLGHVPTIRPVLRRLLEEHLPRERGAVVVDVGCGSAWALEDVAACRENFHYFGLDFNPRLVAALKTRESSRSQTTFLCHDIEESVPSELQGRADVVLNIFNFIETPDLAAAVRNCAAMLRPSGALIVCHVDPISQMVSMADTLSELHEALQRCAETGWLLSYDKYVDLSTGRATFTYKGVAYPYSMIAAVASRNGLAGDVFEEVLWVQGGKPQLYELGLFRRR
jgi:SAM-dependent methyltransferase